MGSTGRQNRCLRTACRVAAAASAHRLACGVLLVSILLPSPARAVPGIMPWFARIIGEIQYINVTNEASYATLENVGVYVGTSVEIALQYAGGGPECTAGVAGDFGDWLIPAAYASVGQSSFAYDAFDISIAGGAIKLTNVISDQGGVVANDLTPTGYLEATLCDQVAVGPFACDWLAVYGTAADVSATGGTAALMLDDSYVGTEQRGVKLAVVGGTSELLGECVPELPEDPQFLGDLNLAGGVVIDLIDLSVVDDFGQFGEITIAVNLISAEVTYSGESSMLPALGRRGGAMLVVVVLAFGALLLWMPRIRSTR